MKERHAKGKKGNPFYVLEYSFEKGILRLDPYPLMDENKTRGLRLILKDMWPVIIKGALSREIPTSFLYVERGPAGNLYFSRSDIIQLAEEVEERQPFCADDDFRLNAYLLHQPVADARLQLSKEDEHKRDLDDCCYSVFPVQFFHIEVVVPKEIRKQVKILEALGI